MSDHVKELEQGQEPHSKALSSRVMDLDSDMGMFPSSFKQFLIPWMSVSPLDCSDLHSEKRWVQFG